MTKEEAINEIRSWDFLNGKEIEAVQTLIPELCESKDERIRSAMIRGFNALIANGNANTFAGVTIGDIIAYLEKQKEQKPAWSEEDERKLIGIQSHLKYLIENCFKINAYTTLEDKLILENELTWLKSLHPQPKQEWSEKDKKILDDVSHILWGLNYKQIAKDYKQVVEKLIYTRPSWKPSKEQIDALHEAVIRSCSHRYGVKLLSLEIDLLNLK